MRSLAVPISKKVSMVSTVPTQLRAALIMVSTTTNALAASVLQEGDERSYLLLNDRAIFWSGDPALGSLIRFVSNDTDHGSALIDVLTKQTAIDPALKDVVVVVYRYDTRDYMRVFYNDKKWKASPWYKIGNKAEGELIFVGKLEGTEYLEMVPIVKNLIETKAAYPIDEILKTITNCNDDSILRVQVAIEQTGHEL